MNRKTLKEKMTLNPIMTFIILIVITIIISGILTFIGLEATYNKINSSSGEYVPTLEVVESLFSLSGIKYIFSNTVSNFASFAPLINLIIVLFGIGIMEKSGFLKTFFTLLTKKAKKHTITFVLVLISILSSIGGDLGYVVLIPLSALLFMHGKRNPLLGIIASFAGLTAGNGLNVILTSVDSTLLSATLLSAEKLDSNYVIGVWAFLFIMIVAIILITLLITRITENVIAPKLGKYKFKTDEEEIEETEDTNKLTKNQKRGLALGFVAISIYMIIFLYCIIPGLPFSGKLLDNSQILYIDKLFSYNSFFSNGFVFIVTMLFVLLGFFYGIGSRTIKNNNDVCIQLGYSLDGIGKPIILIFFASTFISIFKKTNIGNVITAIFANVIESTSFQGLPLIILLFLIVAIVTLLLPSSTGKWGILSAVTVPILMNSGVSPEFTQIVFRFAESMTMGLTPLLAYSVIYLAWLEKYNQSEKPISLFTALKYQLPYSLAAGGILLLLIIVWYLIGLPIGIGGSAVI